VFPLWFDHVRHGASVVLLTKAIGLAAAARIRRHSGLHGLAERQLQWTLGCNPFSRSLMYGVGKDWWQNFTVEVPNLVGGLAVGMNSYTNDSPAWGNNAVFPYKEIWVVASSRAALLLARLIAPAPQAAPKVQAQARARDGLVELQIAGNGRVQTLELRYFNLGGDVRELRVAPNGSKLQLKIADPLRPWAIVLLPNGKITDRQELFGTAKPLASIA